MDLSPQPAAAALGWISSTLFAGFATINGVFSGFWPLGNPEGFTYGALDRYRGAGEWSCASHGAGAPVGLLAPPGNYPPRGPDLAYWCRLASYRPRVNKKRLDSGGGVTVGRGNGKFRRVTHVNGCA